MDLLSGAPGILIEFKKRNEISRHCLYPFPYITGVSIL